MVFTFFYLLIIYFHTNLISKSDLVIHHGGNNTFNECFYYGKPSIVLPFAWDGFDNAMRLRDLDLGIYLDRYKSNQEELAEHIDSLLNNTNITKKLKIISTDMKANPGVKTAVKHILKLL